MASIIQKIYKNSDQKMQEFYKEDLMLASVVFWQSLFEQQDGDKHIIVLSKEDSSFHPQNKLIAFLQFSQYPVEAVFLDSEDFWEKLNSVPVQTKDPLISDNNQVESILNSYKQLLSSKDLSQVIPNVVGWHAYSKNKILGLNDQSFIDMFNTQTLFFLNQQGLIGKLKDFVQNPSNLDISKKFFDFLHNFGFLETYTYTLVLGKINFLEDLIKLDITINKQLLTPETSLPFKAKMIL